MAKLTKDRLAKFEDEIERLLFPVLDRFSAGGEITSEPDEPDARTRVDAVPSYVQVKLDMLALRIEDIFAEPELLNGLEVIGERVSTQAGTAIRRVAGIAIRDAAPEIAAGIDRWRAINVSRIKSLAGEELVKITNILQGSEAAGLRVEVLRKEIEERFGVTRAKADLLARDQTLTLNSQIAKARQQAAGIEEYIWTTSGDERVRTFEDGNTDHARLDGKTFRWDTGADVGDGRMLHPGEDYQCRCTAFPVLVELA
jgi:SPP1 gp7 family putative phage head morphogenesis protein